MAIKIEMLRCFVAVADCGNLAEAAKRLSRSPSAVSMTLKQLEDHLGRALFESDRKNRLSPTGLFVLARARQELARFTHTVQSMERFARAGVDTLRIASVPSVAGTVLPVALARFLKAWPDLRVELRERDSASVLRALREHRVDLGIASADTDLHLARRVPLFDDAFGLVCRTDHPLARDNGPIDWQALAGEMLIANALCETIRAPVYREIRRHARLAVHDTGSLLRMVRMGLGITILPRLVVHLDATGLVFRELADTSARRRLELMHRSDDDVTPAAQAFGEQVADAVRALAAETDDVLAI